MTETNANITHIAQTSRPHPFIHWEPGYNGGAHLVTCPLCGGDYTHHDRTAVFDRTAGEDTEVQVYTLPGMPQAALRNNPSSRRGAVRIELWGECGHTWYLDIAQHKGRTLISAMAPETDH